MMNVKITSMTRFFIIVLVIMDYSLFYLIDIPNILHRFWSLYCKFLPGIISLLLCIIIAKKNLVLNNFLNNYLFILAVSILMMTSIA